MKTALLLLLALTVPAAELPSGKVMATPPANLQRIQAAKDRIDEATKQLADEVGRVVTSVKVPADFDDAWGDGPKLDWFRMAQTTLKAGGRNDAYARDLAGGLLNMASYPIGFWDRAASGSFNIRPKPKN